MFTKLKKSKGESDSGFTIIEVMIVLAIAGLILLIVFLAIPALQRNSRNTQRKDEAGRVASAVSNFVSNNNGLVPTTAAQLTTILNDVGNFNIYQGLATGTGAMAQGQFRVTSGAIGTAPTIAITGTAPTDAIELDTAARCIPGGGGTTQAGSSTRSMALLYTIEPGTGANYQVVCQDI